MERYCLWITDDVLDDALQVPEIARRVEAVRETRLASKDKGAQKLAERPHQFREMFEGEHSVLIVPRVSSERRHYLPAGIVDSSNVVTDLVFAIYDAPLWTLSLITSTMHRVWIAAVCGRLETRIRYSNTLGWNTFPVPALSDADRAALTRCAEAILLAREVHFPATIAELYDPDTMPENLRRAHAQNDEVVERIFAGKRFQHDSERLEWLFREYERLTDDAQKKKGARA